MLGGAGGKGDLVDGVGGEGAVADVVAEEVVAGDGGALGDAVEHACLRGD